MATTVRDVFQNHSRTLREGEFEADAPAFVWNRFAKALAVGLAGSAAYLLTLTVISLLSGRTALYPLRAIYAVFNGNRYLPSFATYPLDYGVWEATKSFVWVASIGMLAAIAPALWAPARVLAGGRVRTWLPICLGWSLALFFVAFVVFGFPASRNVQRYGSSYQGVRALGTPAFAAAHVAYGIALGLLLPGATRTKVLMRR